MGDFWGAPELNHEKNLKILLALFQKKSAAPQKDLLN